MSPPYPAAAIFSLEVPTPVTFEPTTPELFTKFEIFVTLPVLPKAKIALCTVGVTGTSATASSETGIQPFVASE